MKTANGRTDRLDSCEVIDSPLTNDVSYPRLIALGHVAELLDELLPDREANDALFRLTISAWRLMRGNEYLDAADIF